MLLDCPEEITALRFIAGITYIQHSKYSVLLIFQNGGGILEVESTIKKKALFQTSYKKDIHHFYQEKS